MRGSWEGIILLLVRIIGSLNGRREEEEIKWKESSQY
jgi:hypothetical protein